MDDFSFSATQWTVRFIEAECESSLDDIAGHSSLSYHPDSLFPCVDYSLPIHEIPLCLVQLTTFKCGGIGIGISISHAVVDGPAGKPPLTSTPPSLDDYPEYKNLPLLLRELDNLEERKKKSTGAMLRITKSQVEHLRKMANDSWAMARGFTRFETTCGHVWRIACKASVVGDLTSKPLGFAASKVREAVEKVTYEYVRSSIELLKHQKNLSKFQDIHENGGIFYGNPNIEIVSWLTLPLYGYDFGWGKEQHMGLGSHGTEGNSALLLSPEGDGSVLVDMCPQEAHVNAFKKQLYEDIKGV